MITPNSMNMWNEKTLTLLPWTPIIKSWSWSRSWIDHTHHTLKFSELFLWKNLNAPMYSASFRLVRGSSNFIFKTALQRPWNDWSLLYKYYQNRVRPCCKNQTQVAWPIRPTRQVLRERGGKRYRITAFSMKFNENNVRLLTSVLRYVTNIWGLIEGYIFIEFHW